MKNLKITAGTLILLMSIILTSCGDGNRDNDYRDDPTGPHADSLISPTYTPRDTIVTDTIDTFGLDTMPRVGTL